jgi:hypothetical protein
MAQNGGGSVGGVIVPGGAGSTGAQTGRGTLTQEQFNKLQDYADTAHRLTKEDREAGRTLEDLLAQDKAIATDLAVKLLPSCKVNEAILASQGTITVDGKSVEAKTYEVTCASGMGYFLVSQEPAKPYAISCFAADATKAADIAAGRAPGAVCQLPSNANINAMATALMSGAGTQCTVKDHRWVGQNAANHLEFDEVKCGDNAGYMLTISLEGHSTAVSISTCHDSALRNLPCKMSDNGEILSNQTFKDVLDQRKIACDGSVDKDIKVLGQENVKKRYVVEFRCSQRPSGLVAFIPLAGATAPFETADCPAAAKRGVRCVLNTPN